MLKIHIDCEHTSKNCNVQADCNRELILSYDETSKRGEWCCPDGEVFPIRVDKQILSDFTFEKNSVLALRTFFERCRKHAFSSRL